MQSALSPAWSSTASFNVLIVLSRHEFDTANDEKPLLIVMVNSSSLQTSSAVAEDDL